MLTSVSDYSGVVTEDYVGLSGQAYDDFIQDAIQRAYLTLRNDVPQSTFDDAKAAFASNTPTEDQLNLRWAEYWLTRYEIEVARLRDDVVSERAGNLQVTKNPGAMRSVLNRYRSRAMRHLSLAGFDLIGGSQVAGVRGGNPLDDEQSW